MNKLKYGIIGLGKMATDAYLPASALTDSARLVAVCDLNEGKVQSVASELGIRGYSGHEEMMSAEKLDFVVILTPHNTHRAIVEYAAANGINVLKEKPAATSLVEAEHLERVSEAAGIQVFTSLQRRLSPIYSTFFDYREMLGEPYFIDARYTLSIKNPGEGWRGSRSTAGGGCIIDMGYHPIDLVIWYFGLPGGVHAEFTSKAVSKAKYDAEDMAHIMFNYEGGLNGSLVLSRSYGQKSESMRVVGSDGTVEIERDTIRLLRKNGEVRTLSKPYDIVELISQQIDNFCLILSGIRENTGGLRDNMPHMAFVEACYASKGEGGYVNPRILLSSNDITIR